MTDNLEPTSTRVVAALPRSLAGLLLIAAAFLKFYSPAEAATLQVFYNLPKWLIILGTHLELALGLALLTGVLPRLTRRLAIVVFGCFAMFSLYRLIGGYESCGCFGSLKVPPWVTSILDLTVLTGLLWQRDYSLPICSPRWALATYALLAAPMISSVAMDWVTADAVETRLVDTTSSPTILEPETWIGKPFPVTEFLEPAIDLSQGESVLLFYHHDCPHCQEALPKYEHLAADDPQRQVLLIEVPPYGPAYQSSTAANAVRLSDRQEWFVQAPVEVTLNDGTVKSASLELPAVSQDQ